MESSVNPSFIPDEDNVTYNNVSEKRDSVQMKNANGLDIEADKLLPPMSKNRILKNVFVLSLGFLCLFTSFQSLTNLQTSLNSKEGIGTKALSVLYAGLVVSCMFIPPPMIGLLGCKWTVVISMLTYIIYLAGNFYPSMAVMIVVSIIVGLGAAPLWSAKCSYLTELGIWYARFTNGNEDAAINRFFGFFFMAFQTSQIWGNLISSLILATPNSKNSSITLNSTQCGSNVCPGVKLDSLLQPEQKQVDTMKGIYCGFGALAAIIVAIFLDNIRLDKEKEGKRKFSIKLAEETVRHFLRSTEQKLLVPLTLYSGVEQAFILATFTSSYVNCTLGVWNVGLVMICFGVVDAICSFTFGRLVQWFGHAPFFGLAAVTHGSIQIALLFWLPSPDQKVIFYVFSGLWGMGDAVIQTQINALYGYLFSDNSEAAFANYRLWESVGFIITFAYGNFLCTDVKLYICIGFLVLGMVGYVAVEIFHRRHSVHSIDVTTRNH